MPSIRRRLLIGTAVLLAIVIVVTGIAVNVAVHKRAEDALEQRLQGLIYGLLGATDVKDDNSVVVNETELPDPQLSSPSSELYAEIIGNLGETYWRSVSRTHTVPSVPYSKIGEWEFSRHPGELGGAVYHLQLTLLWELSSGDQLPLIVHVVTDSVVLDQQLSRFKQFLWTSLAAAAALLLLMQAFILRHALEPLSTIGQELRDIETGNREALNESVAKELKPLAVGINTLLLSERARQTMFKNLVDDLAHSLKTPLTVLKNVASSRSEKSEEQRIVREQTEQMQQSLQHYLERASGRTTQALVSPVAVAPILKRLSDSLNKIHPNVTISTQPSVALRVSMAEADLFEVFGNLLDNACKYGATEVVITAPPNEHALVINDNGRGFDSAVMEQVMQRGVRADSQVAGQGLGLANSRDRLNAYGGSLHLAESSTGGGQVHIVFPTSQPAPQPQ